MRRGAKAEAAGKKAATATVEALAQANAICAFLIAKLQMKVGWETKKKRKRETEKERKRRLRRM